MDYGSEFMDMVMCFMADDDDGCNSAALKCFTYELKLKDQNKTETLLQESESNVEHCVIGDNKGPLSTFIEDNKTVNMINPSRGTLSRFKQWNYSYVVDVVYLLNDSDKDYVNIVKNMCSTMNIKTEMLGIKDIDVSLPYYLSFNGSLGAKLGLKKYMGYEPNFYQLVFNELCSGIDYNDSGNTVHYYRRRNEEKTCNQKYVDCVIRYGADALSYRYKDSKRFDKSKAFMHDIVSSIDFFREAIPIQMGRSVIINAYGLCGDYHHDKYNIFDVDGNVVYHGNNKNHCNRTLDNRYRGGR